MTEQPTPNPTQINDIDIEEELLLPSDKGQERSIARRLALQILYETDSADHDPGPAIKEHLGRYALRQLTSDYTVRLVHGVTEMQERLDMIIQTVAQEWPLDQVAIVDRNILRIAVYEYAFIGGLPVGVVTDEAVTLARVFGTDASLRFVNGVLGSVFENQSRLQAMLDAEIPDEEEDDDDREDEDET
ncbi:MAG: transcription antitermination factor NusB [Chloroflexota bacterium]